jgi:type II secretory pathway component PulC
MPYFADKIYQALFMNFSNSPQLLFNFPRAMTYKRTDQLHGYMKKLQQKAPLIRA